ncbi:chemotaxis protein CheB [Marinibacterium sp. SX1]|uniref:chemotaxis protein CheB n=1 Tax=Marinibacterium sp. SX1 TaxID=3388424 RepID=UPI003D17588C
MAPDTKSETAPQDIVAIAASAGGLEATSLLAQNLPTGQNCCYVIAQHMSPTHKSMLVQLLSRETSLAVEEIQNPTLPQANTIYIPPPGHDVVFENGSFVLRKPLGHPAAPKPSADRLFKSLAQEKREHAIGIVLSGTGSDGTYGIQAIREASGITIAQEPGSSKYDSMPVSAIRTGCVDLTLPPQQIGQHLGLILQRPRDLSSLRLIQDDRTRNTDLYQILLAHTMVDFRQYKESTINRRVHRRMIAKGIEDFDAYVELCRRSVEEVDALYRDLLISVTSFFRDPDQFEALAKLLRERAAADDDQPKEPLRVWVPGCATGEEAYTIAILVIEALGGLDNIENDALQVFATDIDQHALAVARKGSYPPAAASDIPREYLNRYFEFGQESLLVKPKLKNFVMFSRHNVFQDAPFISVDLVSIRNVLIYFSARLQERVLTRIQYALKADGMLLLGTSETTGVQEDIFVQVEPTAKIFRKRSNRLTNKMGRNLVPSSPQMYPRTQESSVPADHQGESWARFDVLARAVVRNGLVTNRDRSVLKIYGDIAPFAEMTRPIAGGMTLNVLLKPLAFESASMTLVTLKQREMRYGQWHNISGRDFDMVRMVAYPLPALDDREEDLVLIGFVTEMRPEAEPDKGESSDYVTHLETELARSRETLQVTIEQLQTSNEELQSVNEELQSANEELQSTNEELETTNEELQSTNEELITVNEELLVNTAQLERISAELRGLIHALPAKAIMLDQGLLIRHASAQALADFGIRDRGHSYGHLSQINLPAGYPPLIEICSQALVDRKPRRFNFETDTGSKILSVAPLISGDDQLIGLVVLAVTDETVVRPVLRVLSHFGSVGTWQYDPGTKTAYWSQETARIHGVDYDGTQRSLDSALSYYHPDDREQVARHLELAQTTGQGFQYRVRLIRPDGRLVVVEAAAYTITNQAGEVATVIGVMRDRSRSYYEELLAQFHEEMSVENEVGFYCTDIEFDVPTWSPNLHRILGYPEDSVPTSDAFLDRFSPEARERIRKAQSETMRNRTPMDFVERITMPDGSDRLCRGRGRVAIDDADQVTHLYGSLQILEDPDADSAAPDGDTTQNDET